jgi:MFS family permease
VGQQRWYKGSTRGQWLALTAALLGWMFDGFEMGIFPQVARPALISLLGLSADAQKAAKVKELERDQPGSPLLKEAQEARQRVDTQVSPWNARITAAFLLGAALGGWLFGWLGDRVGRVRAMVGSVLTYSLFTGLCGLAQDPWQLGGVRFLAALGMGGEWSLGVALVMECWAPHARPMLAGLIGAASNVGFMLAAALVLSLQAVAVNVSGDGWRWVLGCCAVPALLTFFLRMFVPESEKWAQAVQQTSRPGLLDIFTPALRWRTIMGAVLSGIVLIGTWGSIQWIPLWVQQMHRDPTMPQICGGFGAVVGTLLGAWIGHVLGRRWAFFTISVLSLASCSYLFRWHFDLWPRATTLAAGWSFHAPDLAFLAAVTLAGGLTASYYGLLPLYLPELFPTRVRATGQGFGFNFGRVIAAGGALSMGALVSDAFGGDYAQGAATISLIYVAGMIVIWLAPETQGQPLPE